MKKLKRDFNVWLQYWADYDNRWFGFFMVFSTFLAVGIPTIGFVLVSVILICQIYPWLLLVFVAVPIAFGVKEYRNADEDWKNRWRKYYSE